MGHFINKLEAAQRQLDCAIRRWFEQDDLCAVQTLSWAAFTILRDLGKKQTSPVEVYEPVHVFDRKAANFLKHADRDPDAIFLDIEPWIPEMVIYEAVRLYRTIAQGPLTLEMDAADTIITLKYQLYGDSDVRAEERREEERERERRLDDMNEDEREDFHLREVFQEHVRQDAWMEMGRKMLANGMPF